MRSHLLEGGRDQAGQADHVGVLLDGGVDDGLSGHHHPEIDHLVVVAAEHHAHDVLADVVDVALDGGHDHAAVVDRAPAGGPLGLHERLEMGDRALHDAGALDDLGQEHLAGAEQVTDRAHARHQRPLDDVDRAPVGDPRFFGVVLDEIDDAVDQRVLEPPLDGLVAPGEIRSALGGLAGDGLGEAQQALGGVGAAIEDHVLGEVAKLGVELLVHAELAGVDDAHVHARGDGVVQERRVHGLAYDVVAPEAEAQVRDPAGDLDARAGVLDLGGSPR